MSDPKKQDMETPTSALRGAPMTTPMTTPVRTPPDVPLHTRLPDDADGVWLVTTRSSEHFFDLGRGRYLRRPSGGHGFPHDLRWCPLTRVDVRPTVGGKFFVWVDDPDAPEHVEHWRQSSTIATIAPYHGPDPSR